MKKRTRKLMSVLVALAIVCSMIPAALAAYWPTYNNGYDFSNGIQQNVGINTPGGTASLNTQFPQYATYNGWPVVYAGQVEWSDATGNFTVNGSGSSATVTNTSTWNSGYYGESTQVVASGLYYPADQYGNIISTVPVYINQTYTVTVGGTTTNATVGGSYYVPNSGYYDPNYGYYDPNYGYGYGYNYLATMSQNTLSLSVGGGSTLGVAATSGYFVPQYYTWSSSNSAVAAVSNSGASTAAVTGVSAGQATITATISGYSSADGSPVTATASCLVTVSGAANYGDLYMSGSTLSLQPNTVGSYNNYGTLSVTSTNHANLLTSSYLTWSTSDASVAQVAASTVASTVYIYAGNAGQATITATLKDTQGNTVGVASCLVTVGSNAAGEINYSLATGQSKALSATDFATFWSKVAGPSGTLSYITFGTPVGNVGSLKYYASSTSTTQSVVTSGLSFYANPTSTAYRAIDSVSFVPTAYGTSYYTGTLTVPFVAYGTTTAASVVNTSYNGKLTITVTNGAVDTINYSVGGSAMALNPTDFVTVYKKAMNVTAATTPSVYIQFQNVPTFGTLYYNYGGYNNLYGTAGTMLTSANIGSMYFSTLTTAAYGIDDVTYVPSASGAADAVRYTVYSTYGGTPLYTGEVRFTATAAKTNVVKYHTTPGATVKLAVADFQELDALKNYSYIALGTPTGGKLYTDYKNGTGAAVTKNTTFALSATGVGNNMKSITAVTVVPTTSSGVVKIPFTASTYTGAQTTGTIEVYVAKKFPDVSATNWANEYITELVAKGVVSGDDKGNFNPKNNLTYGEALKLIMEACGYNKQVKTSTHWASGYLAKAYADGLVTSSSIDLDKAISRDDIAEITAKALGLKATYTANAGISDPVDSSNGYVQALYNAGILAGSFEGGKNYYYGSQPIIREQISKIICLAADYHEGKGGSTGGTITGSTITTGTTVTGTTTVTGGTTATVSKVYTSEHETTYHRTSTCLGKSYPDYVFMSQAEASGRSACATCFPK